MAAAFKITDDIRRSFPKWSDERIAEFLSVATEANKDDRPTILATDLMQARIIRDLGWQAYKEFLFEATGSDTLDADDYLTLSQAVGYLREAENFTLYSALFGSASEVSSKQSQSARKKNLKALQSILEQYRLSKEI